MGDEHFVDVSGVTVWLRQPNRDAFLEYGVEPVRESGHEPWVPNVAYTKNGDLEFFLLDVNYRLPVAPPLTTSSTDAPNPNATTMPPKAYSFERARQYEFRRMQDTEAKAFAPLLSVRAALSAFGTVKSVKWIPNDKNAQNKYKVTFYNGQSRTAIRSGIKLTLKGILDPEKTVELQLVFSQPIPPDTENYTLSIMGSNFAVGNRFRRIQLDHRDRKNNSGRRSAKIVSSWASEYEIEELPLDSDPHGIFEHALRYSTAAFKSKFRYEDRLVTVHFNFQERTVEIFLYLQCQQQYSMTPKIEPVKILLPFKHILLSSVEVPNISNDDFKNRAFAVCLNYRWEPDLYRRGDPEECDLTEEWYRTSIYDDVGRFVNEWCNDPHRGANISRMREKFAVEKVLTPFKDAWCMAIRVPNPRGRDNVIEALERMRLYHPRSAAEKYIMSIKVRSLTHPPDWMFVFDSARDAKERFIEFSRKVRETRGYQVWGLVMQLVLNGTYPRRYCVSSMDAHRRGKVLRGCLARTLLGNDPRDNYTVLVALQKTADIVSQHRVFEIDKFFEYYLDEAKGKGLEPKELPADRSNLYHIYVTPSKTFLRGPYNEINNRVLRDNSKNGENFIRATFCNSDTSSFHLNGPAIHLLCNKLRMSLESGLEIGHEHFQQLCYSNSQLRSTSTWMVDKTVLRKRLLDRMGDFEKVIFPGKKAARKGQCFSSTRKAYTLTNDMWGFTDDVCSCVRKQDEKSRDGEPPLRARWKPLDKIDQFNFTDGVGRCRKDLMEHIAKQLELPFIPSAIQIRYQGFKGVLAQFDEVMANDTTLGPKRLVQFRNSQEKFKATSTDLEVCEHSTFIPLTLNKQLVFILDTLGVPEAIFRSLVSSTLEKLKRVSFSRRAALSFLKDSASSSSVALPMGMMLEFGFSALKDAFLSECLVYLRKWVWREQLLNFRIPIEGANLFGVADETWTLKYDDGSGYPEVFIQVDIDAQPDFILENQGKPGWFQRVDEQLWDAFEIGESEGRKKIIKGLVMVSRSPQVHPGDVILAHAVDKEELRHLVNVIVFPMPGDVKDRRHPGAPGPYWDNPRDIPNMLSGGDLDGDKFQVSWYKPLVNVLEEQHMKHANCAYPPAEFFVPGSSGKTTNKIKTEIDFFISYQRSNILGIISNAHLAQGHIHYHDGKASHETCLELARLHSLSVDFGKTGIPAEMDQALKPSELPHFMEKETVNKPSFFSDSVMGNLYDLITENEASATGIQNRYMRALVDTYELDDGQMKISSPTPKVKTPQMEPQEQVEKAQQTVNLMLLDAVLLNTDLLKNEGIDLPNDFIVGFSDGAVVEDHVLQTPGVVSDRSSRARVLEILAKPPPSKSYGQFDNDLKGVTRTALRSNVDIPTLLKIRYLFRLEWCRDSKLGKLAVRNEVQLDLKVVRIREQFVKDNNAPPRRRGDVIVRKETNEVGSLVASFQDLKPAIPGESIADQAEDSKARYLSVVEHADSVLWAPIKSEFGYTCVVAICPCSWVPPKNTYFKVNKVKFVLTASTMVNGKLQTLATGSTEILSLPQRAQGIKETVEILGLILGLPPVSGSAAGMRLAAKLTTQIRNKIRQDRLAVTDFSQLYRVPRAPLRDLSDLIWSVLMYCVRCPSLAVRHSRTFVRNRTTCLEEAVSWKIFRKILSGNAELPADSENAADREPIRQALVHLKFVRFIPKNGILLTFLIHCAKLKSFAAVVNPSVLASTVDPKAELSPQMCKFMDQNKETIIIPFKLDAKRCFKSFVPLETSFTIITSCVREAVVGKERESGRLTEALGRESMDSQPEPSSILLPSLLNSVVDRMARDAFSIRMKDHPNSAYKLYSRRNVYPPWCIPFSREWLDWPIVMKQELARLGQNSLGPYADPAFFVRKLWLPSAVRSVEQAGSLNNELKEYLNITPEHVKQALKRDEFVFCKELPLFTSLWSDDEFEAGFQRSGLNIQLHEGTGKFLNEMLSNDVIFTFRRELLHKNAIGHLNFAVELMDYFYDEVLQLMNSYELPASSLNELITGCFLHNEHSEKEIVGKLQNAMMTIRKQVSDKCMLKEVHRIRSSGAMRAAEVVLEEENANLYLDKESERMARASAAYICSSLGISTDLNPFLFYDVKKDPDLHPDELEQKINEFRRANIKLAGKLNKSSQYQQTKAALIYENRTHHFAALFYYPQLCDLEMRYNSWKQKLFSEEASRNSDARTNWTRNMEASRGSSDEIRRIWERVEVDEWDDLEFDEWRRECLEAESNRLGEGLEVHEHSKTKQRRWLDLDLDSASDISDAERSDGSADQIPTGLTLPEIRVNIINDDTSTTCETAAGLESMPSLESENTPDAA